MEIERMFLLMLHVLSVVVAAIGIAFADLSLFKGREVDEALLRRGCLLVAGALGLLWLTGLSIIWIDTAFDLQVIASRPKLVAKVAVAVLLSVNGGLLHRYFFNAMDRPPANIRRAAALATVMAAVSGASWLYAGFLGLAKPLAPFLGLAGFAAIFLGLLSVCGLLVAWLVHPRMVRIYCQRTPA